MGLSASHIILVVIAVLILFGAGRLPKLMEDLAKGMKAFKKGMKEEEISSADPSNTAVPIQNTRRKKSDHV